MKIGILTFHRAINFGAILQCYALYRTLNDMGHDVEVVDYRPAYIEKFRKPLYWRSFKKQGGADKLKILLLLPVTYWNKRKSARFFDSFIHKNIKCTSLVKKISDIPLFDVVFFGSDQIWNPRICEGFDPLFWGQFPKGEMRFISYAASLGTPQLLTNEQWAKIFPLVRSFDSISVREPKLEEYLQNAGFKVQTVLDPTLMASKNIFEKIVEKPKDTGYVLLYMLENDNNAVAFANRLAKQRGKQLICVTALSYPSVRACNYKEVVPRSVGEFLGYFKYADYVVNISFHGTAFSIIFNKDFYTLKSKNFERAYGLLNSLDLLSRFVSSDEIIHPVSIHYSEVNDKLAMMKKISVDFINNVLK